MFISGKIQSLSQLIIGLIHCNEQKIIRQTFFRQKIRKRNAYGNFHTNKDLEWSLKTMFLDFDELFLKFIGILLNIN